MPGFTGRERALFAWTQSMDDRSCVSDRPQLTTGPQRDGPSAIVSAASTAPHVAPNPRQKFPKALSLRVGTPGCTERRPGDDNAARGVLPAEDKEGHDSTRRSCCEGRGKIDQDSADRTGASCVQRVWSRPHPEPQILAQRPTLL